MQHSLQFSIPLKVKNKTPAHAASVESFELLTVLMPLHSIRMRNNIYRQFSKTTSPCHYRNNPLQLLNKITTITDFFLLKPDPVELLPEVLHVNRPVLPAMLGPLLFSSSPFFPPPALLLVCLAATGLLRRFLLISFGHPRL